MSKKLNKFFVTCLLFVLSVACFAFSSMASSALALTAPEPDYYTPTELGIHTGVSSASGLYIHLYGGNHGHGDDWLDIAVTDYVTINGTKAESVRRVGQDSNMLYVCPLESQNNTFSAGDKVVVSKGMKYYNLMTPASNFIVLDEYTFSFSGSEWSMSKLSDTVTYTDSGLTLSTKTASDASNVYVTLSAGSHGYQEVKTEITELGYVVTLNDQVASLQGVKIYAGGSNDDLLFSKESGFAAGDVIKVGKGTKFFNSANSEENFHIPDDYTITYDGSSWTVINFVYGMEDGMLSDFTSNSIKRLVGADFQNALPVDHQWLLDIDPAYIGGEFVAKANLPAALGDTTNGAYRMSWPTEANHLFPTIMFDFTQNVSYDPSNDIVIRLFISDITDKRFDIMITSSLNPKPWECETTVAGTTLSYGWNEIHLAAADYRNDSTGRIAPIAFTFAYSGSYALGSVLPEGEFYFDTAKFVEVKKDLVTDYASIDISEAVPLGDGKTFVGEYVGNSAEEAFDFTKETNVCFIRTDKVFNEISMYVTINDISHAALYFVINGTDMYYQNGGIYYWLSPIGVNVGYYGKNTEVVPYPEGVTSGQQFKLTIAAIPFLVNGIRAGYMAELSINDQKLVTDFYVFSSTCYFGKYFGMYMHDSSSDINITINPIEKSTEKVVDVKLSTMLNATRVSVGDSLKLSNKVTGKFYGEKAVTYEIVDGYDFAELDADGYLTGLAEGEVRVRAVAENVFGKFYSETLTIKVGEEEPAPAPGGDTNQGTNSGCFGMVESDLGMILGVAVILAAIVVVRNAKKNEKN